MIKCVSSVVLKRVSGQVGQIGHRKTLAILSCELFLFVLLVFSRKSSISPRRSKSNDFFASRNRHVGEEPTSVSPKQHESEGCLDHFHDENDATSKRQDELLEDRGLGWKAGTRRDGVLHRVGEELEEQFRLIEQA